MVDRVTFSKGLSLIAEQIGHPATKERIDALYMGLADETDNQEWALFSAKAQARCRWTAIPRVDQILDALSMFRGQRPVDVEAAEAYERVIASGIYRPEGGTTWNYRHLVETCGRAAAEAFFAAGGQHAFATSWDESRRRERFLAAYQLAARQEPGARLLPPGDAPKQLEPGADPQITAVEAKGFLEKLHELLPDHDELKPPPSFDVHADEERLAELRRQAEQLRAEDAEPVKS
jgi:hypothetical protein